MGFAGQKKILLVDDEPLIAAVGKKLLEKEGYSVTTAAGGEEAVEIISCGIEPVDLVLMDIDLGSGMDGTKAAVEILKIRELPVVFLSSHTEKEIVQKTENITSYGYVVKDSGVTVLDASIKMAFKLFRANLILEQQKRLLAILNEIIAVANAAEDRASLFANVLDAALSLLGYDAGGIYIIEPGGCYAEVVCSRSLPDDFLDKAGTVSISDSRYCDLFKKGIPIVTNNYEKISPEYAATTGFCSVIGVPLFSKNRIIGSLNLVSRERYVVTEEESSTLMAIGRELGTIIERISAEEESKKAFENMKTLFNSVDEMVFIFSLNGRMLYANETVMRRLQFTEHELVGRDPLFLHRTDDRERAERVIVEVLSGVTDFFNIPFIAKDGTLIHVETKITRGIWNFENVIIAVSRDVSKQRMVERALEETEKRFATLFDFASDGLLGLVIGEKRFTIANMKICEMLGYSKAEMLGLYINDIHPEDSLEFVMEKFKLLADGVISVARDIPVKRKNGEIFFADVGASSFPLVGKKCILGSFRDITGRRASEDRIIALLNEKELLLKEMNHRLKNNMNTISGLLSCQADMQADGRVSEVLYGASGRIRNMMMLYNRLYCVRPEGELPVEEFFTDLVREIVNIFPGSGRVNVISRFDDFRMGPDYLSAAGLLLNELISNSMKYAFAAGNGGSIIIDFKAKGRNVVINYKDDGKGIPESVTPESSPGFGMQLVSMLARQMDGSVRIEGEPRTEFVIEFILK